MRGRASRRPALGPGCAELLGALDKHPLSRLLWRRLKPLVLGKLLFAPDTPFTPQLMAQVRMGVPDPSLYPGGRGLGGERVPGRPCQRSEAPDGAKRRRRQWAGEGLPRVGLASISAPASCR